MARCLTALTPRSSGSISVAKAGHAQTVGGEPRVVGLVACGASASHAPGSELVNDATLDLHDNRMCSWKPTAVASTGASDSPDPFLLDQFQFHRAPTGMADRISAASERYASRQRCQKHGGQQQPQQFLQAQTRSTPGLPHDPESSRFWEARLLSRACQSLAFHISSHFHVPTGALDPLASVLSSSVPSHTGTPTAAAATPIIFSLPPPQLHTGAAITHAAALQGQNEDLYGMYDNLAAVYALKTVAGALIDPALWRSGTASVVAPPPTVHAQNRTSDSSNRLNPQHLPNCRNLGPKPAPEPALQTPQSEAPSAVNALIHVVSAALLRLSHTCGHPGCYSIVEPPATVMAAVASGASAARLPGVPFAGRQLARLYDMAYASCAIDAGALAGVPASTAAAVLLLLAAAQPPQHPAVRKAAGQGLSPGAAAASACRGGGKPSVPAGLLARYLRVGSRAHNPLDTVRVMWALLRLQMPDAGSLLQPAELDGGSSSSGGKEGAPATGPPQQQPDPMPHLGRILFRQLQNRDRALAALRGARPGELYGTWQLAVQVIVLIRDRALVRQHSEAALAQLDSALALLEATLTESGSTSRSTYPSGSASKSGSGSGSAPAAPLDPQQNQQNQQNHTQASREKVGGSSGAVQDGRSDAEATATAAHDSWVTAVVSLQDFLGLCKEATAARETAADSAVDDAGGGGKPAWDVLPWSDAEWRSVLGDTEQRAAVLFSTWPELGRLVEQQPQNKNHVADETAERGGTKWEGAVSMPRGTATAAAVAAAGPMDAVQKQQQRRLRIHMQSYSALHFCTLELLYRAVKAQAPDATLLTPLSPPKADATSATTRSQRILSAVALPYSAAVDMVFTDASGRRVGLCLAHLGASRRAPGEIAVLQYALVGWPEADVAAAQQRFRAARATAAVAAAHAQARAARTAAPTAAASSAFAMVGAAAAAAAAAVAVASQSGDDASDAVMPWSLNMAAPRYRTAAAADAAAAVAADADVTALSEVRNPHEGATDRCNHQLEIGVGDGGGEVNQPDEDYLGLEERALAEAAAAALEADAAAVTAAAATGIVVTPPTPQVSNLDLDDVIALELDHDWFHLRENYYDAVRRQNKWDPDVRQAISMAMSYMELPWEAQLDMVWHALAAAGVELPIRVFA